MTARHTGLRARPTADGLETIRVLSVPYSHVYVWHLADPDGADGVVRLPDPVVNPGNPMASWWPPPSLNPSWLRAHADEFDLMHVHFGFDAVEPEDLAELVSELRRLGKPLVYTVHDLLNPHHEERAFHDRQLEVLIGGADAVITLTDGAAAEIRRRWGRTATVLPHPHVVPLEMLEAPRTRRDEFVVGVHLKSIRANMAPVPVLDCLVETVALLPGVVLRVNIHDEVMEPTSPMHTDEMARLSAYLRRHADAGAIDLRVHPFFSDEELYRYLAELDLSVLPYRFGTHSGWMEACYDLGTPVLAPDCGYYSDQRPCLTYGHGDGGLDGAELARAVRRAVEERPRWQATRDGRVAERRHLAAVHREVYEGVLTGHRRGDPA